MPEQGLDEEKLAALLRWGTGLQGDVREEVAAAGRAIVMLIEEIERLHVLAWSNRLYPRTAPEADAQAASPEPPAPSEPPDARPSLLESLRSRLRRGADPAAAVDAATGDADAAVASPPSTFGE